MAKMHWEQLLRSDRLGKLEQESQEPGRTPFHKDHDRIVFSNAFRRLTKKTQVHSLSHNDNVHNRLTHSLEVSCVGRSLGIKVGQAISDQLPRDFGPYDLGAIVQSACLAHDIGNPPFGHFGEASIRHWFSEARTRGLLDGLSEAEQHDFLVFEGNAQGFRILTQLEYHYQQGGMRLTYAVLGAFLKYPWTSCHPVVASKGKYGCNQSERACLDAIATKLGLLPRADGGYQRHPLVYLMEAADDICYAILDLEDGVELGLLREEEVVGILLPLVGQAKLDTLQEGTGQLAYSPNSTKKLSLLRGKAIEHLVNAVTEAFVRHQEDLLNGVLEGDLIAHCDEATRDSIRRAKEVARQRIFRHTTRTRSELGAYATLDKLLSHFIQAAHEQAHQDKISFKSERLLMLMGSTRPVAGDSLYTCYLKVLDFISGMTDNYAVATAREITGHFADS
ncbi:deoxyguanosinetriphosphate triphosphohydrolase [Pokkaliibacter sp. CJK22405]|uniref:deoxyguanosinetriphosphate triphosphohydrolase n=1 Tax=Pokkaliibacter sp. CJK22405 TaxID=3384615 RepID=UPI0039849A55